MVHLNTRPIDILITDLKMPRMNGYDLLKQVKKLHQKVKVIVMTGSDSVPFDLIKSGAVDFFSKPIDVYELAHRVHLLIHGQALKK